MQSDVLGRGGMGSIVCTVCTSITGLRGAGIFHTLLYIFTFRSDFGLSVSFSGRSAYLQYLQYLQWVFSGLSACLQCSETKSVSLSRRPVSAHSLTTIFPCLSRWSPSALPGPPTSPRPPEMTDSATPCSTLQ
jgi:hypothetical protein